MSRLFYHTMQDNVGNLLFNVSGTMRLAGTGTLATIYGDEALTVILPNPMTNHPSFGSFKCFLPVGDFDFYMAKPGYTFETLTGVQGYGTMAQQDAGGVAITGGSATFTGPLSANDTFFVTGTSQLAGHVGIGVAPPSGGTALEVGGNVLATGNLSASNDIFGLNGEFGGRVGIATAVPAPGTALHVGGNVLATGNLSASNDIFGLNGQFGGRVGIGQAPPAAPTALGVTGHILATGNLSTNAALFVSTTSQLIGNVGIGAAAGAAVALGIHFDKATTDGLALRGLTDGGSHAVQLFLNNGGSVVGSVTTTAAATAYNTSSDMRLKTAIAPLTGALDVVRALRPITGRWKADDSPLTGFLAHEVAEVVDGVITGDKDAVDEQGRIMPQQIDPSKLVVWLVGACQALASRVEALEAAAATP